jgi:hypothetical protein
MSMRDAVLHIPLTAGLSAMAFAAIVNLPPIMAAAAIGTFVIFFREITQEQASHHWDFRTGWDFWNRSLSQNLEWLVPGIVAVATAVEMQSLWGGG